MTFLKQKIRERKGTKEEWKERQYKVFPFKKNNL